MHPNCPHGPVMISLLMPTPLPDNLSSLATTPLLSYTFFPHAFMSHASLSTLTVHCNSTYILYFYSLAWLRLQKADSQYETSLFTHLQHMKAVHGIMEQNSRFRVCNCNWIYGYIKHFFLVCFCQIHSWIKDVCMLETVLMACLLHPTVYSIFHLYYISVTQRLT